MTLSSHGVILSLLCTVSAKTSIRLYPRSTSLFTDDTAYDRLGEFLLVLTLALDLLTLATTTTRTNKYKPLGLFILDNLYYFFVMLIHFNFLSDDWDNILGLIAAVCGWIGATLLSYYEFVQFSAIMKAVRPNYRYLAEGPKVIVTFGVFVSGVLLVLDFSTAYITLPSIFSDLTLVNLVECIVCIPRLLSTFWILYVVKDIAEITDGVVRKLGKNYIKISGVQIVNGLVGLVLLLPSVQKDDRLVSLVGSIVEILLYYSVAHMLTSDLSSGSESQGGTSYNKYSRSTAAEFTSTNYKSPTIYF
ncbi:hypothetical protein HDV06_005102 [Boothiomyces sp. JEL0866]|nr:hypothetical protein HDV06_005102 [Boothiomyces sp. JEL0866]